MSPTPPWITFLLACALISQAFFAFPLFITIDMTTDFTFWLLARQLLFGLCLLVLAWGVWTRRGWGSGEVVGFEVVLLISQFLIWMPPSLKEFLGLPVLVMLDSYLLPLLALLLCLVALLSRPFL